MMPHLDSHCKAVAAGCIALGLAAFAGCTTSAVRLQSPDSSAADEAVERARRVGDYVSPQHLRHIKLEAVGLAIGLNGTGSDPAPSSRRAALIAEMQAREIRHPNKLLASPDTSLVLLRTYLPPAVQKGDRLDVEGPRAVAIHHNQPAGRLVDAGPAEGTGRTGQPYSRRSYPGNLRRTGDCQRRERGHGRRRQPGSRTLVGRRGRPEDITTGTGRPRRQRVDSSGADGWHGHQPPIPRLGPRRSSGELPRRRPTSTSPLRLHPRYKKNLRRYIRVVQRIPVRLSPSDQVTLLQSLEQQLLDPATAENAAIELEALGNVGAEVLAQGLDSADEEVRFQAAVALAYLNDERGATALAEAARYTPNLRWSALTALAVMDDISAYDHLIEMLHDSSAETRYGAFRALQQMNPNDPVVRDQGTGDSFHYHTVATTGEPLVHVTLRGRPEIVIFSHPLPLKTPVVLFAENRLMVDGRDGKSLKVTRYSTDGEDRHEYCAPRLDDMLRAVEAVGGDYADAIQLLHHAKEGGYLNARLAFDAVAPTDNGRRVAVGRRTARSGKRLLVTAGTVRFAVPIRPGNGLGGRQVGFLRTGPGAQAGPGLLW